MEQGRRPDQMEFSAKANFYCILVFFMLAVVFSFVQPIFERDFRKMAIVVEKLIYHVLI